MIVSARIARIGNQRYGDRVEHRPASTVFAPESMRSFEGAPVTVGHIAMIDATNVAPLAVGYAKNVRRDGIYLTADLHLLSESAARRVQSGELTEISCGYLCDSDPADAVIDGERVSSVQRNVRGNHVALLPSGAARCGSGCSIDRP